MGKRRRPSFLFILSDQQRRDSLGCYGNTAARTPCLDRIARNGVVFEHSFTANVVCSPSRASLLTGRYPRSHGLVTNGMWLDEDREITLPEVLSKQGYFTGSVGKVHLSPHGDADPACGKNETGFLSPECPSFWKAGKTFPLPYHGFQKVRICSGHASDWMDYDRELRRRDSRLPDLLKQENALSPPSGAPSSWKSAIPEEHHPSTWVADEAIRLLSEFSASDAPFFLFAGFPDPHFPYSPPAPWCDMFDPAKIPMPRRGRDEKKTASVDYRWRLERFAKAWPYHPMDMPDSHIREIIAHTYGMVSLLDKNVGRIIEAIERLGMKDDTVVVFTTDHGEHLGDHWLLYKCSPYDELTHLPLIWHAPSRFMAGARPRGIVSHVDMMPTILDLAGIDVPRGVQGKSFREALEKGECKGRPYAFLEDDDMAPAGNGALLRTLWTPEYRLSFYQANGDGELFDLRKDPNELVNRWHDPGYRDVRMSMTELMLKACMEAADPKPEMIAPY